MWSGWVGIAQKTGFGLVSPLPGIWPSLHLDTAITLPVGVEAYAAYALRAWLARDQAISGRTRRFAKWSAIFSFALGMAGQVAYHLMAQAGMARAPWADHHRRVLPAGPGPGHGDRAGPHAPRRRRHPGYAGRPGRPVSHPAVLDPASPDQARTTSGRTLAQTGPLGGTRRDLPQDRRTHRSPGRSCGRCSHRPIRLVPSLVSWLPQDGPSHGGCCAGGVRGSNDTLNALARTLNAELEVPVMDGPGAAQRDQPDGR